MTDRYISGGSLLALAAAILVWASPAVPRAESVFFARGVQAFSAQKYPSAVVHFKAALRESPDDPMSLYYLALSLYHIKRYDEAFDALLECGRLEPDFRDYIYHYYAGAILFRKRLYLQAKEEFEQTVRLHPRSRLAEKVRGLMKDIEQKTHSVPPGTIAWYLAAAERGLEAGNPGWASMYAREAFLLQPAHRDVRLTMARVLLAQEKYQEVPSLLSGIESAEARILSGRALTASGQLDAALEELRQAAASASPETRQALVQLAERARGLNDNRVIADIIALMEQKWPEASETAAVKSIPPQREPDHPDTD